MRKVLLILLSLSLMILVAPVAAQQNQPPVEVQYALLALNSDANTTLTFQDMSAYAWQEYQFETAALGCPQEGVAYAQVMTDGYLVLFTYAGTTYDYRIVTGTQTAYLCSASLNPVPYDNFPPAQVVILTQPVPPVQPTPIRQPVSECPNGLDIRLSVGEVARTTPQIGSNVRAEPDLNAEDIGTIPPSGLFTIVGGAACSTDGLLWWQVNYDGLVGWVAQGQDGLYYVEPIPQPLLVTTQPIVFGEIDNLLPLTAIKGNLLGEVAWSPDGTTVAIADASTAQPAVWLYSVADLSIVPRLIEVDFDTTALAFSPDGIFLAIGDPTGMIHFVNLGTLEVENSFVAHTSAVLDIDFSPDGRYMVSVDDTYTARFFGVPNS